MKPSTIFVAVLAACAAPIINGLTREFATPWAQDLHRSFKDQVYGSRPQPFRATQPIGSKFGRVDQTPFQPNRFTDDIE